MDNDKLDITKMKTVCQRTHQESEEATRGARESVFKLLIFRKLAPDIAQ